MWKWLLEKLMNYVVGKDVFGQIQTLVEEVATEDISGAQKKEKVVSKAKEMGGDFATYMLNFAVEAAVTLVKEKTESK